MNRINPPTVCVLVSYGITYTDRLAAYIPPRSKAQIVTDGEELHAFASGPGNRNLLYVLDGAYSGYDANTVRDFVEGLIQRNVPAQNIVVAHKRAESGRFEGIAATLTCLDDLHETTSSISGRLSVQQ